MAKTMMKQGSSWLVDDDWQPLELAHVDGEPDQSLVARFAQEAGITPEQARAEIVAYESVCRYYVNDIYQVQLRVDHKNQSAHLNIRRRDGNVILRDWRHFQWIKNELVGPECEAVELYPAESRLVDSNNKYHLWCSLDTQWRFPLGMDERDVNYSDEGATTGTKQRRLV